MWFILISFILLLLLWYKRTVWDWRTKGVRGEFPIPFLGTSWLILWKHAWEIDLDSFRKFGPFYVEHLPLTGPMLNVADLALVRQVMFKSFSVFSDKLKVPSLPRFIRYSLISISGPKWKRIRSIVTPIFTSGRLRTIGKRLKDPVDRNLTDVARLLNKNKPTKVDVKKWSGFASIDMIANVVFSMKVQSSSSPNEPFFRHVIDLTQFSFFQSAAISFMPRALIKLFGLSLFKTAPIAYFFRITEELMRERRENPSVKFEDFLQLMMDSEGSEEDVEADDAMATGVNKKRLTMEELVGQCLFFFIAGVDTVSNAITASLYYLAKNPEKQQKLYEELKRTFPTDDFLMDDLSRCEYLKLVVMEALRLLPPVTKVFRCATEDFVLENNFKVRKGQLFAVPIYAMHHNSGYFENPEQFYPERFEQMDSDVRNYGYLPFSGGPMNCAGYRFAMLEIEYYLAKFLLQFHVQLCDDGSSKFEFMTIPFLINFKDLHLSVTARS